MAEEPRFPGTKRPAIPTAVQDFVVKRDEGACVYCGATTNLELDHVFPFAQGGSSDPTNLVLACRTDNLIASDRVFPEFVAKKDWIQRARAALGKKILDDVEVAMRHGAYGLAEDLIERPRVFSGAV